MTRGGAGWPGRRPDDCFAAPVRCMADESVSEANQISGEPNGEPAQADGRGRTAASSDEQRSYLALQTHRFEISAESGLNIESTSKLRPQTSADVPYAYYVSGTG